MNKTPLHAKHSALGAKLVSFSGYEMPIFYSGISEEHRAVRNSAGLFDVSHMGQIFIKGNNRMQFLDKILTSDISTLSPGCAQYSVMCNSNGGIIDDLLVYCYKNYFMLVVNAGNKRKILKWLESNNNNNNNNNIDIEDKSSKISIIAIKGPKSRKILSKIFEEDLKALSFYNFFDTKFQNKGLTISRTGYTGELGYEIYCSNDIVVPIWDSLLDFGKTKGLVPAGLGARDLLRIEMKYCLYGNDINDTVNPFEAGLGWVVSLDKKYFIGKEKLENLKSKILKKLICFKMEEKAIPRNGYSIIKSNKILGKVTSGGFSSVLNQGIGMGFVSKEFSGAGNQVEIDVRGKLKKAKIQKSPLYQNGTLYA